MKNVYKDSKMYKAWIFLFTCAFAHIAYSDIVPDCSAGTCIRTLRRFFSNRGVPKQIGPDNGIQFTADETQSFISLKDIE